MIRLLFVTALGAMLWMSFSSTEIKDDEPEFDQAAAISALQEKIAGREDLPADSVFSNIEILKGIPAGRLLKIMEYAFNNSLGVTCTHCHDPKDWANEINPEKQVAREMWAMTGQINQELLSAIPNLSENAVVNCTTCHRGEIRPALRLE